MSKIKDNDAVVNKVFLRTFCNSNFLEKPDSPHCHNLSSSQKAVTEKKQQNKKKKNLSDALRKNLLRRKVEKLDLRDSAIK